VNYTTSGDIARAFDHQPWTRQAACHGLTHIFFPRNAESLLQRDAREARAKAVCATCPVIDQCREHADAETQHGGVWAGVSVNTARTIDHGTAKGYRQHYRRGESPCDDCKHAYNAAVAARRKAAGTEARRTYQSGYYQRQQAAKRARIEQMQRAAEFRNNGGHAIDWEAIA